MMRRIVVLATSAVVALGVSAEPTIAHHRPTVHCSPSGDVCQSTRRIDGVRVLRITLAARYFRRFELCVTDPADVRVCKDFRIRARGEVFGSSVRWKHQFPRGGPGPYDVRWRMVTDNHRVGRLLGFHVRPR